MLDPDSGGRSGRVLGLACSLVLLASGCAATSEPAQPIASEVAAPTSMLGTWTGVFHQHSHTINRPYPMVMDVQQVGVGGELSGTIRWPDLSNGMTSFSGNMLNGVLKLTENKLLRGQDIAIGGQYFAYLTPEGRLKG